MKYSIRPILYTTIKPHFKHITLIPHPFVTYHPNGNVIESGVSSWRLIVGVNLIFFEFSIIIEEYLDNYLSTTVSGDEPNESQVTSIPEKTIDDL